MVDKEFLLGRGPSNRGASPRGTQGDNLIIRQLLAKLDADNLISAKPQLTPRRRFPLDLSVAIPRPNIKPATPAPTDGTIRGPEDLTATIRAGLGDLGPDVMPRQKVDTRDAVNFDPRQNILIDVSVSQDLNRLSSETRGAELAYLQGRNRLLGRFDTRQASVSRDFFIANAEAIGRFFFPSFTLQTDKRGVKTDRVEKPLFSFLQVFQDKALLAIQLAGVLNDKNARGKYARTLKKAAREDSARLKKDLFRQQSRNGVIEQDVVIAGGGVHASAFASTLRALVPDVKMLALERSDTLGGVFATPGLGVEAWYLNSRGQRVARPGERPIAGGDEDLNPLGSAALTRLPFFTGINYPTNADIALASATNLFHAAPTALQTEYIGVERNSDKTKSKKKFIVNARDARTGKVYRIYTDFPIIATGTGERAYGVNMSDAVSKQIVERATTQFGEGKRTNWSKRSPELPRYLNAFDFLNFLTNPNPDGRYPRPYEMFQGKTIAILGDADTSKIVQEALELIGPASILERQQFVAQTGIFGRIFLIGAKRSNREEQRGYERPRYQERLTYLRRSDNDFTSPVTPITDKSQRLRIVRGDRLAVDTDLRKVEGLFAQSDFQLVNNRGFDYVIDATGFKNLVTDGLLKVTEYQPLVDVVNTRQGQVSGRTVVTRKADGTQGEEEGVYVIGPAGGLSLRKRLGPAFFSLPPSVQLIPENPTALFANIPGTEDIACQVSSRLKTS